MLSRYVHIRSLQCVKITCKFTERFLRNREFLSWYVLFGCTLYIAWVFAAITKWFRYVCDCEFIIYLLSAFAVMMHKIELQPHGNYFKFALLCLLCSANSQQSRPGEAGFSRTGPSSSLGAIQDRLKPPVSAINMEHKVIKLSGSKSIGSSSSKDHIQTHNSHHLKQPAVSESNSVSSSAGDSNVHASRKIRLSHQGLMSAAEKPQQQQNVVDVSSNTLSAKRTSLDEDETEKKKFKATAITWP